MCCYNKIEPELTVSTGFYFTYKIGKCLLRKKNTLQLQLQETRDYVDQRTDWPISIMIYFHFLYTKIIRS